MNLQQLFSNAQSLPQIPKVVLELIESFNNEDIDISIIAKKLSNDPVLTAKVLRLANSAHYGIPKTVSSVDDAAVILGMSSLRTMILASCMSSAFKPTPGYDQASFWRSAFRVAAYAKFIAEKTNKADKDVAFTTGMLHSIGALLIRHSLPDETAKIDETQSMSLTTKRYELEQSQLGFDYTEVGGELARRWKFPDEIQEAIEEQVAYDQDKPYSDLAAIIYLAKYLEQVIDNELSNDDIQSSFPKDLASDLGLSCEEITSEMATLKELNSGLDAILD